MPTQQSVQQTILSAQLLAANKTEANWVTLAGGGLTVKWGYVERITRLTTAVLRQYNLGDYVSANFTTVYDCLVSLVGLDTTVNTIDPNFQNPAFIIGIQTPFAPVILNKTDSQLIDAGGGNWYLPFLDNSGNPITNGSVPVFVTDNGVSFTFTFDQTFSPARIFGFGNNVPVQTIVVTVI
jgi:hypothetical protein